MKCLEASFNIIGQQSRLEFGLRAHVIGLAGQFQILRSKQEKAKDFNLVLEKKEVNLNCKIHLLFIKVSYIRCIQ